MKFLCNDIHTNIEIEVLTVLFMWYASIRMKYEFWNIASVFKIIGLLFNLPLFIIVFVLVNCMYSNKIIDIITFHSSLYLNIVKLTSVFLNGAWILVKVSIIMHQQIILWWSTLLREMSFLLFLNGN